MAASANATWCVKNVAFQALHCKMKRKQTKKKTPETAGNSIILS